MEDDFAVETYKDENEHRGSIRSIFIDEEMDVLYTGSNDSVIKVIFLFPVNFLIKL